MTGTLRYQIRLPEQGTLRSRKIAVGRGELFVEEETAVPGDAYAVRDGRALVGARALASAPWRTSHARARVTISEVPFDVLFVRFSSQSPGGKGYAPQGQIRAGSLAFGFYRQGSGRNMELLPFPRLRADELDGLTAVVRGLVMDALAQGRAGRVFTPSSP